MTIQGPKPESYIINTIQIRNTADWDIPMVMNVVADGVVAAMDKEMGMPVTASIDEYSEGGGFFSKPTISPALAFRSKEHADYTFIFATFKRTGGILEIMIAQGTLPSKNWQRVAAGKLLGKQEEARQEDLFYDVLYEAIQNSISNNLIA